MANVAGKPAVGTDCDIIRMAVRKGGLDQALGYGVLNANEVPSAALRELLQCGALDRKRVNLLRQEVAAERDPQELGGYKLGDVLGFGGMGVVYRAVDANGREAAVKVLSGDMA